MPGILYLVPTPIGNLGDVSARAAETLSAVDFIAAEDTRVSVRLLNHLEIKKPLVSYHEHNQAQSGPKILARLQAGESCALVTDAGSPAISDPGEGLVRLCAEQGVPVCAIPGPCAAITALSVSGLSTARFAFEGFLPPQKKERRQRLERLAAEDRTMIFYEAPHRLRETLAELEAAFGPERKISLCRELTKLHEEILRTTLHGAAAHYAEAEPRGEFVLIVAGSERRAETVTPEGAADLARSLIADGMSKKDAARQVAAETGVSRNVIYNALISGS
jgi:16S rRNA (cytidine1402-2'-O)-methyltransferase